MDSDLNIWLKDDLGLVHMSAADLNGLMFHPRHGGLCRRLVRFLAESTLCSTRYPTVYVKEEYQEAAANLATKDKELQDVLNIVYNYTRDQENVELELGFLAQKLDYLKRLEDLQQTSKTAMEEIVNRPNFGLEQVSRNINTSEYLSETVLKDMYHIEDVNKLEDLPVVEDTLMEDETSMVEDSIHKITRKVNMMHRAISALYKKITDAISRNSCDVSPKNMQKDDLVALQVPTFKEIHPEMNSDERELRKANTELVHRVNQTEQQVGTTMKQFLAKQNEITKTTVVSLNRILDVFKRIEEIESSVLSNDLKKNSKT